MHLVTARSATINNIYLKPKESRETQPMHAINRAREEEGKVSLHLQCTCVQPRQTIKFGSNCEIL